MKKFYKALKVLLVMFLCWAIFVTIEAVRLIGSTNPGKCPFIICDGLQYQDKIADYGSLGFSQIYHLTDGDSFVYGEFKILGIRIAQWEE